MTWVNDVNGAILCTFEVLQFATHVVLSKMFLSLKNIHTSKVKKLCFPTGYV